MSRGKRLKAVFIISYGIRGHVNQSRGVAHFYPSLRAARYELEINEVLGNFAVGFWTRKAFGQNQAFYCIRSWAEALQQKTKTTSAVGLPAQAGLACLKGQNVSLSLRWGKSRNVLFLSAGSVASLYSFALAKVLQCRCATIMTPSALGTKPFDFAIVPKHDCPKSTRNVYVTLGAPNMVTPEKVRGEAEDLASFILRGCLKG